ncbi:hypothetical protein F511_19827 [Dorcoceras hygrometricum]|uniref:Uncharacterized protein n=1 Tax=Dorcoceras hygrometricum TaxID=472368 RepID=A0A2Z7AWH7_9LAMI|nr:hypothetical protein F511_19827 [Dorcoceras hygrometricum]
MRSVVASHGPGSNPRGPKILKFQNRPKRARHRISARKLHGLPETGPNQTLEEISRHDIVGASPERRPAAAPPPRKTRGGSARRRTQTAPSHHATSAREVAHHVQPASHAACDIQRCQRVHSIDSRPATIARSGDHRAATLQRRSGRRRAKPLPPKPVWIWSLSHRMRCHFNSLSQLQPPAAKRKAPKRKLRLTASSDDEFIEKESAVETVVVVQHAPTSADDVDSIIEQVVTETARMDTDDELETAAFETSVETEMGTALQDIEVTQSDNILVEVTESSAASTTKEIALATMTDVEQLSSDEELMSIDDLLKRIPGDMMLPSVLAVEPIKIKFGLGISIPGVANGDLYKASIPKIALTDKGKAPSLPKIALTDKGKAPIVTTNVVKGHPAREMVDLIFGDIDFIVQLRENVIDEVSAFYHSFSLRRRTPQNSPQVLNTLSSVSMRESRIQYLCDPQWFRDTASRGPTTIVAPESQFRTCPSDHDSIGYTRISASGESSTTMHRLLHASGSHPIPPPNDPKTNQYNQDLGLIHSTNGNHLESPNEGSSIDHQVTIYLHAQNITMFPTNETLYFTSQILVSSLGGLILILTAQSTRN